MHSLLTKETKTTFISFWDKGTFVSLFTVSMHTTQGWLVLWQKFSNFDLHGVLIQTVWSINHDIIQVCGICWDHFLPLNTFPLCWCTRCHDVSLAPKKLFVKQWKTFQIYCLLLISLYLFGILVFCSIPLSRNAFDRVADGFQNGTSKVNLSDHPKIFGCIQLYRAFTWSLVSLVIKHSFNELILI